MNRSAGPRVRTPDRRLQTRHRPKLEYLEPRLAPGDALLGLLLAWPALAPDTRELDQDVVWGFDWEAEDAPAFAISRPEAVPNADGFTATPVEPISESNGTRAAGLIPAVRTAGINPAARCADSFGAGGFPTNTPLALADFRHAVGQVPALAVPRHITAGASSRSIGSLPTQAETPNSDLPSQALRSEALDNYGKLPLAFEANHGQTDLRVDFITRTGGATVFLTPTAAIFSISASRVASAPGGPTARDELRVLTQPGSPEETKGVALHMQIVGANPDATPVGQERQPGIVNYFIGNDPSQWHANIPTFGRVEYQDVYPGIDLVYYGNNGQMEYDFMVAPGADPNAITLNFAGADGVEINPQGDLVLHTAAGDVVQQKPITYQEVGQTQQEVTSRYVLDGTNLRFEVGAYDATRPLVIDPLVLGYSTYLGGSSTDYGGWGIAVDGAGNAYATGHTLSTNFPTTPGALDTTYNGGYDVFAAKLNASGSALAYGTYLGGSRDDYGGGIALDGAGNAYVTGQTDSTNFPTTPGAFDTTYNDGPYDLFVAKLSGDGNTLAYGNYLGGSNYDSGRGIAVDGAGNAYVTGYTNSTNFPTTRGAFDTTFNGLTDVFVAKLSGHGSTLAYGTYLGGSSSDYGRGIALDGAGNAYVTGYTFSTDFPTTPGAFDTRSNGSTDAFVAKLLGDGGTFAYGTYLGGAGGDLGYGIAVDGAGNAYVTGYTDLSDFPTTPGAYDTTYNGGYDVFAAKLSGDGSTLAYGTYVGGAGGEGGYGIAVDGASNAYATGFTYSTDFPTTPGAFDNTFNGGTFDAFLFKLSASGSSLVYGTYLGGSSDDYGLEIAVAGAGNAHVTGITASTNFPTTPGAFKRRNRGGYDAFVTKFAEV